MTSATPFLIGSVAIVERAMKIMGCDFAINRITHPEQARFRWGTLDIMETGEYDCDSIEWGKVQKNWRARCRWIM